MGLLDEAIREHLELKRRRGADPGEIARQEREALGPARQASQPVADEGEPAVAAAAPVAEEWEEEAPETAVDERGFDEADEGEDAEWNDGEDDDEEPEEVEASAEPPTQVLDPAPRAEASAPPAPAPPPPAKDPGEQTSEYDVLGEDEGGRPAEPVSYRPPEADEPPDDAEDVLEETPEFLQETPEHDRLWFEQRPPRDFDFDG